MAVLLRKLMWWWPQYNLHRDSQLQDITADMYTPIEDQPRDVELLSTTSLRENADSSKDEVRVILSAKFRRGRVDRAIPCSMLPSIIQSAKQGPYLLYANEVWSHDCLRYVFLRVYKRSLEVRYDGLQP